MRVIAGRSKGMNLLEIKDLDLRPTIGRVKEAVFSAIQFKVVGADVLDLFAGTGQLGIEALSRGANSCTFIDAEKRAQELEISNLKKTGLFQKARVICLDAVDYLKNSGQTFDVVFLDPPFKSGLMDKALKNLGGKLNPGGLIVCEHKSDTDLVLSGEEFRLKKKYKYGKIVITIFEF